MHRKATFGPCKRRRLHSWGNVCGIPRPHERGLARTGTATASRWRNSHAIKAPPRNLLEALYTHYYNLCRYTCVHISTMHNVDERVAPNLNQ